MLVLAGLKISILQERSSNQSDLVELMEVSVATGNLIHEFQKELLDVVTQNSKKSNGFNNSGARVNTD